MDKKVIKFIYTILLFSFVLPSGIFLKIPLKTCVSILLLFIFIPFIARHKIDKFTIIFLSIFAFVLFWSVLSLINGYNTWLSFLKNYFSLLFVVWISFELYRFNVVKICQIRSILAVVSLLIVLIKICLELILVFNLLDIDSLINIYKVYFSTDLTTMYFPLNEISFYRIMVSNDSIPYVWFSFYLLSNKKICKKILITIAFAFFTIINYSRINILEFCVITLFYLFYIIMSKPKKIIGMLGLIILIVPSLIFLFNFYKESILEVFEMRFNSVASDKSDQIREIQKLYLLNGFYDSWLFGHGTGAYVKEYIRSDTLLYSYEKEYLSFLYQFGLVGFLLIIVNTILFFKKICFHNVTYTRKKIIVALLLCIWILKPIFNPSFLSSNSGIIIVCIFAFFNNDRICDEIVYHGEYAVVKRHNRRCMT